MILHLERSKSNVFQKRLCISGSATTTRCSEKSMKNLKVDEISKSGSKHW